jgi:hypothetical protein
MTTDDPRFDLIRRCHDGDATPEDLARLEATLLQDPEFRLEHLRYVNLGLALEAKASFTQPAKPVIQRQHVRWLSLRPLAAAAAGVVLGIFCTSMVHGLVAQRKVRPIKTPLLVFDAGMEGVKPLDKGLPHGVDEWGARSAAWVEAENGVQPLSGRGMLRLQPSLLGEQDSKHFAHGYQVLDLRSVPGEDASADRKVEVAASFCRSHTSGESRHYIRIFALNQPPSMATEDFWRKGEDEGIVSMTQRFEAQPVENGWNALSATMPLPPGTQSLIIVFSSTCAKDVTATSYLDDVQVSLLRASTTLEP